MKHIEQRNGIYWFRKCLRLHDNPALSKAVSECKLIYPIFILDPWFKENGNVGSNRWRFLWESLKDLDSSLRKLNTRLLLIESSPEDVFKTMADEWNITDVYYEGDTEPYSKMRDAKVSELLKNRKIGSHVIYSHTLYDPNYLIKLSGSKFVSTYTSFLTLLSKAEPPRKSIDTIESQFENINIKQDQFNIPDLNHFCKEVAGLQPTLYPGGET